MVHSPLEAFEQGYSDGVSMAEKMRWQGTPIGNLLKGSPYQPDKDFPAAYETGFKQAMEEASRVEWTPPQREKRLSEEWEFLTAPDRQER
jgi:hypothetical protein